jgi:hypothetical protein
MKKDNVYRGIDYSSIYNSKYTYSTYNKHSMGESLKKYIEIKLIEEIFDDKIKKIKVVGDYDRVKGISIKEKNDKLFNYKRPTTIINGEVAIIKCYPGVDYVYHYASLIDTYLKIIGADKKIDVEFPTEEEIYAELSKSNLLTVPRVKTVILGYVIGFEHFSNDKNWKGNGDFLWKSIDDDKILLGCKHSYWGDISGYIVSILASLGVKNIVYVGKLGTLNNDNIPNETIATGSKSLFIDGSSVEWNNMFSDEKSIFIKDGVHFTLPSIIQETNEWVINNCEKIDYVDPEIGHMAKSALDNNINFSYIHIVSDSLVKKYDEDLSNERKEEILEKRKKLIKVIGDCIKKI